MDKVLLIKTLSGPTRKTNLEMGNRGYSCEKEKALNRLSLQIFWGCLLHTDELNSYCPSVWDNACLCVVLVVGCVQVYMSRLALITNISKMCDDRNLIMLDS